MLDLLTEFEVAEILRCSTSKVKRLRLAGKLAYVPGRPVLVQRSDLEAYVEAVRIEKTAKASALAAEAAFKKTSRGHKDPRQWALNAVMQYRAPRASKQNSR